MIGKINCPNMCQEETSIIINILLEAENNIKIYRVDDCLWRACTVVKFPQTFKYGMSTCGKEVITFAGNGEVFIIH
jgi:hypothetical protein